MAKYSTRKNSSDYKMAITIERKRIRNLKYSLKDQTDSAIEKDLRTIAREVGAVILPTVYVPASPSIAHTASNHKRVTHNLVMRGV